MRQRIITVGREFGSGGHKIAEKLAEHYGFPLLDKEHFREELKSQNISEVAINLADERPIFPFVMPMSYGNDDLVMQQYAVQREFDYIKSKAANGDSFVVVGRCAEDLLRDNPNMVSIFVLASTEFKSHRLMELYDLDEKTALGIMKREDKSRKTYHNFYSKIKWGDSRGYDISINSGRLGIDGTVKLLISFIDTFFENS
ncbi:MAG: cytidylate kinase-like family protein [Oscillospiraceae bacterium]|nr:cytidylate kinase-like family protein [Oscillospiraceae bacterium]